jgi:hypothetical protein
MLLGTAIVGGSNGAEFLHNSYDDWQVWCAEMVPQVRRYSEYSLQDLNCLIFSPAVNMGTMHSQTTIHLAIGIYTCE